jgi:hypothetical protein
MHCNCPPTALCHTLPSLSGGGIALEPNNLVDPPENCAGGNFSEAYGNAAGWADASCMEPSPFVCEATGEMLGQPPNADRPPS